MRGESKQHSRLRILALHGKKSNSEVTKAQLQNLSITDDKYDIVYLDGILNEESGDPDVEEFFNGPFFSWFHGNYTDARFKPSLMKAVAHVYKVIASQGPFDIIYGFSQGATVATMVAAAYSDGEIKRAVMEAGGIKPSGYRDGRMSLAVGGSMKHSLSHFSARMSNVLTENVFDDS